jgi:hypothetical protein
MHKKYKSFNISRHKGLNLGRLCVTLCISTPWFALEIADNFGSVDLKWLEVWCGFKLYWKRNKNRKDGAVYWLKEKTFYECKITFEELEEYACAKTLCKSK